MDVRSDTDAVPPWVPVVAPAVAVATLAAYVVPRALTHGPVLCPFRRITGHPCPTCGLTRSAVAFLHGDLSASFRAHPFGPLVMVVAIAWGVNLLARQRGWRFVEVPARWRNVAVALTAISWMAWWPFHAW
jgi:hypothetical protein